MKDPSLTHLQRHNQWIPWKGFFFPGIKSGGKCILVTAATWEENENGNKLTNGMN